MEIATSSVRTSVIPPGLSTRGRSAPIPAAPAAREEAPRRPLRLDSIATLSKPMHEVLGVIARLARTHVTLTIMGETGTGKDVLAHALHAASSRRDQPFVVFDCGAVAANLAESELFGHERGAFTGAVVDHAGVFERARGGTLFLDEIGELPLDLQPKLLRALESRCIRRVGGTKDRPTDVRIVAATNRDLAGQVALKQFREDLYFRLAAAVVKVPPLRERVEDLPVLVRSLLNELGRPDVNASNATYEALRRHAWPGNVRELKNTLASALAFADGGPIEPHHLRFLEKVRETSVLETLPLGGHRLETIELAAIKQTLRQTRGNKTQAAQSLGIAVSTLYEKLKKLNVSELDDHR